MPALDTYGKLSGMDKHLHARIDPPSNTPNNQDVFIWAMYLLDGADRDVDVEEIFLKCFELAPARLGWRTRPDLPDYKKISKALQSIEAKTHVGLLLKVNEYTRRLTVAGARWIETYKDALEKNYSHAPVGASANNNKYEHLRQRILSDPVWQIFETYPETMTAVDIAPALNCMPASSETTWKSRINDIRRAADVLHDPVLEEFASAVEKKILGASN